jgi:cyclopropane-fatty-acyl-phospholipid synthase
VGTPAADRLVGLVSKILGAPLPVRVRMWDGSVAGDAAGPLVDIRSRRALRRLIWDPNEMGLARAYIAGDLDVDGDLYEGLSAVWSMVRDQRIAPPSLSVRTRAELVIAALRMGVLGPRPAPPPGEARLSGRKHSTARDRDAISHHYDLSNEFYGALLDPSMAYSCGYWDTESDLADAQRAKLDLICRKLGLRRGMRLLDVGCGWGSLITFAAREYGVHATGVTISAQQKDFVEKRIADEGLTEQVRVRLQDYREIDDAPFDAVASIEMGEHVGDVNYPVYAATLHRMLRPEGRLLVQQMSRGAKAPGGGAFIESYIAPDMTMVPVGVTLGLLADTGLEIRDVHALREHYVPTVLAWARILDEDWARFVAMVGEPTARVWRLYLNGGALAFAQNRMGVDQILAVRPTSDGVAGMPSIRAY